MAGDDSGFFDALRTWALGYFMKGTPQEDLIKATKDTAVGKTHVDPEVVGKLLSQVAQNYIFQGTTVADELSDRELEGTQLIAQGLTNAEISKRLY